MRDVVRLVGGFRFHRGCDASASRWRILLHLAGLCVLVMFMTCPALSERFALTLSALSRAVAACHGRGLMDVAMIVLVWTRVRRAEVAFLALLERIRSGRFRGGWCRVAVVTGAGNRVSALPLRGPLPRRFGWLMGVMPYEAAGYASQLRTVLAEPEMAVILRDVASARRILGPLCRMLGVEIPGVGPAVARAAVDDAGAMLGRVRVARVRKVLDFGRIPLPRGVLAAARRQGYGKMV